MARSSIQGGDAAPQRPEGTDVDALGPSDSSDSGSDVQHERRMPTEPDNAAELGAVPVHGHSTSDAMGTGERASAQGDFEGSEGPDIAPPGTESLAAEETETDDDAED